jgi:CspA family cold shock protein
MRQTPAFYAQKRFSTCLTMQNEHDKLISIKPGPDPAEVGIELPLQSPVLMQLQKEKFPIVMQEGTIARLTEKGFGFIKVEGQEKDIFFHSNELLNVKFDELREGDKVSFEVAQSPKGPNAIKVSRV